MIKRESQRLQGLVSFLRFQLAFPNCDTMPAHLGQLLLLQLVTIPVAADFLCPKVHVGSWHPEILASFVPMPKATIHEDASAVLAKHNIRMPRQPRIVEPVAKPIPHKNLRTIISGRVFLERTAAMMSWRVFVERALILLLTFLDYGGRVRRNRFIFFVNREKICLIRPCLRLYDRFLTFENPCFNHGFCQNFYDWHSDAIPD